MNRHITNHPILQAPQKEKISFVFNGSALSAFKNEMLSAALFANGIQTFGHHHADNSPQGIFCANGQCSQCTVVADNIPVKACMTPVTEGIKVFSYEKLPDLPDVSASPLPAGKTKTIETDVLIIGAGPAGLSAAIELGRENISVLIVDDKSEPGGKLVLQTHAFFGSIEHCHAGTRGIDIAKKLSSELEKHPSIKIMLETTAVGVFLDGKTGIVNDNKFTLVNPKKILIACGAREKALAFPGWDLPGVYGAGAFQTLLNRDMVKPSEKLFIIGGGNVGLIAGYHALQAGITVVGIAEALSSVGGYKVHADKIKRLGVPIYTSHTVIAVEGKNSVESITIAEIDKEFAPKPGTYKSFSIDTVLVAIGLNPVNELLTQARSIGLDVFCAGDAAEIAEASAAMFSGKIEGSKIIRALKKSVSIPEEWMSNLSILKSKPGKTKELELPEKYTGFFPIIRCVQEIPCNPCVAVCPNKSITIPGNVITGCPVFSGRCDGCTKCAAICPGLAITLVKNPEKQDEPAKVIVPFEILDGSIAPGNEADCTDMDGIFICKGKIEKVISRKNLNRRLLIQMSVPRDKAMQVAGIRVQPLELTAPYLKEESSGITDETIICRCERVSAGKIRRQIQDGLRDMNQLKAFMRCGMGACGGKTCQQLIYKLFREEGVDLKYAADFTNRPLVSEVPLSAFLTTDLAD
ncbi:MAG: FAD-dependent oxidoreductase [Planctomycetes bacterium]|nr:FAD-dependent oxidoreductase [Planctomycetota bacterium]